MSEVFLTPTPFKGIAKKYILGFYFWKKSFSKRIMFHWPIFLIFICFNKGLCFGIIKKKYQKLKTTRIF